ncbi:hypothetical protein D9M71_497110 [compost metagenome]
MPRIDHQLGDFTYASDVLDPVGFGETEILVEAVAHVVTIKQIGMFAQCMQFLLDEVRDRGLAGTRQPCEPEYARLLPLEGGVRLLVNVNRLPVDVLRATQGKVQESGADRIVGQAVNHDETAGIAIFLVGIKCDWLIKAQVADADFI